MDIAKGLMIMFLIFHHIPSCTRRMGIDNFMFGLPNLFICCFFMQAFFFISGYCSNLKKPFAQQLKSMLLTLMLPNVIFSIVPQALHLELYAFQTDVKDPWFWGAWFLWAMFWGKLYVMIIYHCIKSVKWQWVAVVALFVAASFIYYFELLPNVFFTVTAGQAAFFIWLGAWMKAYKDKYELLMKYGIPAYLVVFLLAKLVKVVPVVTAGICAVPKLIVPHVIVAVAGTAFILAVCRWMGKIRLLEFFGKGSLTVYLLHMYILSWVVKWMVDVVPPETLCTRIVCIALICFITWIPLAALVWLFNQRGFRLLMGKVK